MSNIITLWLIFSLGDEARGPDSFPIYYALSLS